MLENIHATIWRNLDLWKDDTSTTEIMAPVQALQLGAHPFLSHPTLLFTPSSKLAISRILDFAFRDDGWIFLSTTGDSLSLYHS